MSAAGPEIRETHSGIVVLAGNRAYKVKKPVDLGFLDFRTESARRAACLREIELNRRLAPDVYDGLGTFEGPGGGQHEPVVVMRRMPDGRRLSTLVRAGADVADELRAIARLLAGFHASAARGPAIDEQGGAAGLWQRWSDNLHESAPFCPEVLDPGVHAEIRRLALRYIDGRLPLFAARVAAGLAVDGHGDLIAEDVFCLPDGPRVLDCLEFADRLRYVDVLDDAAFLAMDLEHLGRPELGARFLDWYAEFSGTPVPDSLRHHYVAYRAFVRAKVRGIRAAQGDPGAAAEARDCARLALEHLRAGEVRLVLVGGAPGTGKSTLAGALADALGCTLVSSDALRAEVPAPGDRYSQESRRAVYAELLAHARQALEHGESVVADATWGAADLRRAALDVAVTTASRLVALECTAPVPVAAARAEQRYAAGGALSEADARISRALAAERDPWPEAVRVDTTRPPREALQVALTAAR